MPRCCPSFSSPIITTPVSVLVPKSQATLSSISGVSFLHLPNCSLAPRNMTNPGDVLADENTATTAPVAAETPNLTTAATAASDNQDDDAEEEEVAEEEDDPEPEDDDVEELVELTVEPAVAARYQAEKAHISFRNPPPTVFPRVEQTLWFQVRHVDWRLIGDLIEEVEDVATYFGLKKFLRSTLLTHLTRTIVPFPNGWLFVPIVSETRMCL